MHLRKLDKNFPLDYEVVNMSPTTYVISRGLRKRYKYIQVNNRKREGSDKLIPQLLHHPVFRLLQDLIYYDLSNRNERIEFLSALSVALIIDDYNLIPEKLSKINTSVKAINDMTDLNDYIERLETAEEEQNKILRSQSIEEIAVMKSEGCDLAVEINISTKTSQTTPVLEPSPDTLPVDTPQIDQETTVKPLVTPVATEVQGV